ncbi:precorrin-8X methylmutase [Stenomitos frigidus]|uniref:MerR family transcriptional regulator n=1 Tax=Stenomitos frigidus ULC18 TaxID=2107698 RepID=A0A2T1ECJ3_9CYAN|nr:precorrin-8X methylmutase [Stenomitos frigidus]PSB30428.1 MerR family transcriptional regulator [Stenomitos frigidus ULC18]
MLGHDLTIKELTDAVGGDVSPRMVRHYHQLGLLPQPARSRGNYRLYSQHDVQRLQRIVALKQQGFQLSHIHKLLDEEPETNPAGTLMVQFQQQYRSVIQQIAHLRQTASALEGLLGRDTDCQLVQAEAIAQLKLLDVEAQTRLGGLEQLWSGLDAAVHAHPEAFQESLERLLPDLSDRSEIEVDLLSKLVLACGDVSLVPFVRVGKGAIAASREALKAGCQIVADVPVVHAALDHTRLAHLGCATERLIDDCHITNAAEAEQAFWQNEVWHARLHSLQDGCVLVIGYAPSVLFAVCEAIATHHLRPALIIGMPIGFSHAPAAKRQLMQSGIPFITLDGTIGGGLLAAVALNAIADSLIEKPDCHCYLGKG